VPNGFGERPAVSRRQVFIGHQHMPYFRIHAAQGIALIYNFPVHRFLSMDSTWRHINIPSGVVPKRICPRGSYGLGSNAIRTPGTASIASAKPSVISPALLRGQSRTGFHNRRYPATIWQIPSSSPYSIVTLAWLTRSLLPFFFNRLDSDPNSNILSRNSNGQTVISLIPESFSNFCQT